MMNVLYQQYFKFQDLVICFDCLVIIYKIFQDENKKCNTYNIQIIDNNNLI
jgi:hypothetical protein